ncbi:MAG: CARDB domain-containing protein, partial [Euryarchaeota archaeon]|nr:CARDB domain-containing protein [Euryarchaeota archaeon]
RGNQSKFWNNTVCYNMNCSKYYPGGEIGCGGSCADCGVVSASQIANSGGCGIKVESGPGTNYLLGNNTICYNEDWDIYDDTSPADQMKLKGDDNKCNVAFQYKETNATNPFPCDHRCDGWDVDLIILDMNETWHNATHYNVNYMVANAGTVRSNPFDVGIYIDGLLVDTQPVPALNGGDTHTNTSGPYPASIHKIKVCADVNGNETRENENNNCKKDTFGGPDLTVDYLMTNWNAGDASLKNFSMNYKIKNVGDITATNVNVKFCFCNLTHKKICQCKTVNIGNLGAGDDTGTLTVGQFKLPDPMSSYIKCMVDCPDVITENSEHNNFQHVQHPGACYHACGPCACGQGGCGKCLDGGCGDVDCDGVVNMVDFDDLHDYVGIPGATLSCKWAGDVNCVGGVTMVDFDDLHDYVSIPGATLSCCPGACPL